MRIKIPIPIPPLPGWLLALLLIGIAAACVYCLKGWWKDENKKRQIREQILKRGVKLPKPCSACGESMWCGRSCISEPEGFDALVDRLAREARDADVLARQRDDIAGSNQPKLMAASLHQLCHVVRHANETFGGGVRIFQSEPYLVSATKPTNPTNPEDPYIFLMGGPYEGFRFLYFHEDNGIHIIAGGEYTGFVLSTARADGSYRVYTKHPLGVPMGRYAKPLLKVFVSEYGARDTSDRMA